MQKCPKCGRKIGDLTPNVEFVMPDHENYFKTATCPASGKRFVYVGGECARESMPTNLRDPRARAHLAALSLIAGWAGR